MTQFSHSFDEKIGGQLKAGFVITAAYEDFNNALDEVKIAADLICGDCDDDGVAKWLEENVL